MAAEWFWTGRATPCTSTLETSCQCDVAVVHLPDKYYQCFVTVAISPGRSSMHGTHKLVGLTEKISMSD